MKYEYNRETIKENFEKVFDQVVEEDTVWEFHVDGEPKAVLISYDHYKELGGE